MDGASSEDRGAEPDVVGSIDDTPAPRKRKSGEVSNTAGDDNGVKPSDHAPSPTTASSADDASDSKRLRPASPAADGASTTDAQPKRLDVTAKPAPPPPPPPPPPLRPRIVPLAEVLRNVTRIGDADGGEHVDTSKIFKLGQRAAATIEDAAPDQTQAAALANHVLMCAKNFGHKAPVYSCLIAVIVAVGGENSKKCASDLLSDTVAALQRSLQLGEFLVAKNLVRFLACLYDANILEGPSFWKLVSLLIEGGKKACEQVASASHSSGFLLAADALIYIVLSALPWSAAKAVEQAQTTSCNLAVQSIAEWFEARGGLQQSCLEATHADVNGDVDDDTGARAWINANLSELWNLVWSVNDLANGGDGEEGATTSDGINAWLKEFASSIPRPAACLKGELKNVEPCKLSPGIIAAVDVAEATAKSVSIMSIRDHAIWDLDCTVRPFELPTTPDGPVARAYSSLTVAEAWYGRDRCVGVLARYFPNSKLASRALLDLQISVPPPPPPPPPPDAAAETEEQGEKPEEEDGESSAVTATASTNEPVPRKPKRIEPLVAQTVFGHACLTVGHSSSWRVYLADVLARLCQHTASGDCPGEPGRKCTHKGYGRCLTTAVRAVFAGLPAISPCRREMFAEWSANFVAVREHRSKWPWTSLLEGIDFGDASSSSSNEFRQFLENVMARLNGCNSTQLVSGEIVPETLHSLLDMDFGKIVALSTTARLRGLTAEIQELVKRETSAEDLLAWFKLRQQPPPELSEEDLELEQEAQAMGVGEDRTPPSSAECLGCLLDALAVVSGMASRHVRNLTTYEKVITTLFTDTAASATFDDSKSLETSERRHRVACFVARRTALTLIHSPWRAAIVVRHLLVHRIVDIRAVMAFYFAPLSLNAEDQFRSMAELALSTGRGDAAEVGLHLTWKWNIVSSSFNEVFRPEHSVAYLYVNRVKAREDTLAAAAAAAAALEGSAGQGTTQPRIRQEWAVKVRRIMSRLTSMSDRQFNGCMHCSQCRRRRKRLRRPQQHSRCDTFA